MTARQATQAASIAAVRQTLGPALVAVLLGVFIVVGVGLAGPSAIHNAAHDSRHALTFPCH
jgi:cobalt transporter subunit CbtB